VYRTWLIPYLEGTLDAGQRRQLEACLAEDPRLAAELEALRRTEPRLRQAALHLRQTEAVARPAPLWPRLRERLDARPARSARGPIFWGLGGLCTAGAVVLAALALRPAASPPQHKTLMAAGGRRAAPVLMSHRDNARGTPTAARLRKHAARVAAVKRAAQPHMAARPQAGPQPKVAARPQAAKPLPVAPPFAPPLPRARVAQKLPMPITPPFQMAKREPRLDHAPLSLHDLPPAPTHSPPPLTAALPPDASLPTPAPVKMHTLKVAPRARKAAAVQAHGGLLSLNRTRMQAARRPSEGVGRADRLEANNGLLAAAPPAAGPRGAFAGGGAGGGYPGEGGGGTADNAPAGQPSAAQAPPQMQAMVGAATEADISPATLRQRLVRTVTPPLYGTPEGAQELQRLLEAARQAGTLDELATQWEQGPIVVGSGTAAQEAVATRLRAAIYEAGGDLERSLAERRAAVLLATAAGEDWFELAQTEARLSNTASAQRAYVQALRAVKYPLSPAHRAIARQYAP